MAKRDVLRLFPGFRRLATALDGHEATVAHLTAHARRLEAENDHLRRMLFQMAFHPQETDGEADGLPLPPGVLRYLVAGTDDREAFLQLGAAGAEMVREWAERYARPLPALGRVLDFGCGCGRVVRHLTRTPGVDVFGCDLNPHAVGWCSAHLPSARFAVNGLAPPLPYPDAHFGLVYSFSVFTHLTADLQLAWMAEVRRVLAPGGFLLLTVHGDAYRPSLTPDELRRYAAGEVVVRERERTGGNDCAAFHPPSHVRAVLAAGWEVVHFAAAGSRGTPPQDAYLLKSAG